MATIFFPSCKARADYKSASKKLAEYIKEKQGVSPIGCCRINHTKLEDGDRAIVVCNNCAAIIEENTHANIEFVWEMIDKDPDFVFPDYQGEKITVQDCWIAYEKRHLQETVRSLLRKMNFEIAELAENFEKTRFCGVNLLAPCTESNGKLAHNRYVVQGAHMFTPMTPEEQRQHFKEHCRQITTKRVACYCKFCKDGIVMGGKEGIHLLELLFPEES